MKEKTDQPEDNTIHLGICMAGAVSAGAYTAGVIDYLLETFGAWEEAKKSGDASIPTHNVKIAALSGSSAGGIISVMLPKILFIDGMPHVSLNKKQSEEEKRENLLYNTWINFFLKEKHDILDDLLDPADIKEKRGLHSLLNSDFKKRIAKEVLNKTKVNRTTMPDYVSDDLDVIVGITNASGYTYDIEFKNGTNNDAYTITNHRDITHFVATTKYDPANPLHKGKFEYNPTLDAKEETQLQADAARGTSAFPVGFITEYMKRDIYTLKDNDLLFRNKQSKMVYPEEIDEIIKYPEAAKKAIDDIRLINAGANYAKKLSSVIEDLEKIRNEAIKKPIRKEAIAIFAEEIINVIDSLEEIRAGNKNAKTLQQVIEDIEEIKKKFEEKTRIFDNHNLDSGTVNNEPFEHLRIVMAKRFAGNTTQVIRGAVKNLVEQSNKRSSVSQATIDEYVGYTKALLNKASYQEKLQLNYEVKNTDKRTFSNTILLIDPLPDTVQSNRFDYTRLDKVIPQILALLQNQARFKSNLIEESIDDEDFTKFIIAPRRDDKTCTYNGYEALASGFLGAFGGFMKKDYLQHDFYLGRKNCQSFLQRYFVIELEKYGDDYIVPNKILSDGYSSQEIIKKFVFERDGKSYLPIIPDIRYKEKYDDYGKIINIVWECPEPEKVINYDELRKIEEPELKRRKKQIAKRLRTLIGIMAWDTVKGKFKPKDKKDKPEKNKEQRMFNWFELIILGTYLYIFKVNGIARAAIDRVRKELEDHNLYKKKNSFE